MRHSLWFLLAIVLSLPAQATTERRDIRDRDPRCMCNTLERSDSGGCDDIDSRDLRYYYGVLLAPGQRYNCDNIRDGDTRHQCHAIVRGDRKRCDDIDSHGVRRQCRAAVSRVPWQYDGIDNCDMHRICRVILLR